MFGVPTHRFFPQIDPLALRALLDNYAPVLWERKFGQTFVLLKKNPFPPQDHLEKKLLLDVKTVFGDGVPLHEWSNQCLWLEVEIRRSLLGQALSFFYKAPALSHRIPLRGDSGRARGKVHNAVGPQRLYANSPR